MGVGVSISAQGSAWCANLSEADFAATLEKAGLPKPMALSAAQVEARGVSTGVLKDGSGNLSRLIGRPTASIQDAVSEALAVTPADQSWQANDEWGDESLRGAPPPSATNDDRREVRAGEWHGAVSASAGRS